MIPAKGHIEDFDDNCRQYLLMMRHGFGTWREYGSYRQCLWILERAREIGGFAHARLELRVTIASTHWAWPSCKGVWTALRRRRQFPLGGSKSVDTPAESQGHLLGMLGSEGREMGTRDDSKCMLAQCSAAWRHLHCRLYANLGQGYGHTS